MGDLASDERFMPTDNTHFLPERIIPLTRLSEDGFVYVVHVTYLTKDDEGNAKIKQKFHYHVKKTNALDRIEDYIEFSHTCYLAMYVYIDGRKIRKLSTVVVNKWEGQR